jgi:hypothetical protein
MRNLFLAVTIVLSLVISATAGAATIFTENFDGNGPGFGAWTIDDGGDTGYVWVEQPAFWNYSGGTGKCAAVDSEVDWVSYDDKLSYTIDISGYTDLELTANIKYLTGESDSDAYGYVLGYVDGASSAITIDFFSADFPDGETQPYDLSFADGASSLTLAFQFTNYYSGYLMVDDIVVTGNAAGQPESTVPVPAAIWLLGSGLVGLVGLRRKRQ